MKTINAIETPDYQFEISGERYEYRCYKTKKEARARIHPAHNPCLVKLDGDGHTWYDTYPLGHPVPRFATVYYNDAGGTIHVRVTIIERCRLTSSGHRWVAEAKEGE